MAVYVLRRILLLVPVLIGVSLVSFGLLQLVPGDPALILAGEEASEEVLTRIRQEYGLNRPLPVQFLSYLRHAVVGDLGISLQPRTEVLPFVLERFQNTLLLTAASTVISLVIGIPAGVISATNAYSLFDRVSMLLALFGNSMPAFWLGLMAILIFSLQLGWFPTGGMWPVVGDRSLGILLKHLFLPAVTLGAASAAITARITRSSMLEVIRQDYVRTARAKGLNESTVLSGHALGNALLPILTVFSFQFGFLLGGAVLTETVFSWPGVGRLIVTASSADYPLVQGACWSSPPPSSWSTCSPTSHMPTSIPVSTTTDLAPSRRPRSLGFWRDARRRILKSQAAMSGGLVVALFVALAALAPVLAPYEPLRGRLDERLLPPSTGHWFGTDELGRDVLSRVLYGARISLQIQVAAVGLALVLGTALGVVAGYVGRWPDMLIMRIVDIMMAFPGIFLALAIIAALGTGLGNVIIASAIFLVPQFARVIRGSVLTLKEKEFVEAARALGEGDVSIIVRYLLPNSLAPIIVQTSLRMATVLLTASGLSFLGLGVQPPSPRVGRDALQCPRLHDHGAPRRHRPGPGHHAGRARLQPARRWPARCAGSSPARVSRVMPCLRFFQVGTDGEGDAARRAFPKGQGAVDEAAGERLAASGGGHVPPA